VSYETFYRKHCKEGGNCHNPILGYSLKINFFFKIKLNNNNNKGWQRGESKPGNQVAILEKIQGLIVPHYAKKWKKNIQIQG